jgi:hypothetical protein
MMEDHHDAQYDASLWDLPEPAILTPREMLDTREDVNVLGEFRCSDITTWKARS